MAKKKPTLYIAPESIGRPRKIQSPEHMLELWEAYTEKCDTHTRVQTIVVEGKPHDVEIRAPLTYTLEGFCLSIPITRKAFDETYRCDPDYEEVVGLIEELTHVDARSKFEDGTLNPKLAALWMGRHKGYVARQETEVKGGVPVVISGEDDLKD